MFKSILKYTVLAASVIRDLVLSRRDRKLRERLQKIKAARDAERGRQAGETVENNLRKADNLGQKIGHRSHT